MATPLAIGTPSVRTSAIFRIVGFTVLAIHAPAARSQTVPPPRPEFEVASVKLHSASETSPGVSRGGDAGRLIYTNATVRTLIRQAYGLKVYPLSGGADALSTDRYDVIAKVPPGTSKEQSMLMLQVLLEERFKLLVHRETKELPIYVLVVGKSGPKLREVRDDGSVPEIGSGGGHQIQARHISMKSLAASLQGYVGENVVDATGLTGLFDLNLDFNSDESMSSDGITIFDAVQRQLGLKLEARKGLVEVIVIDHVQKSTAN